MRTVFRLNFYHSITTLGVPGEHRRPCGPQPGSNPAVRHPTLGTHGKGLWSSLERGSGKVKIAKAGETVRVKGKLEE